MARLNATGVIKSLLPWVISGSLMAYVLYSNDLSKVAEAFMQASIIPFFFVVIVFVLFWLFLHSFFLFLSMRWLIPARSPHFTGENPDQKINFTYFGVVRASAASYILHLVSFAVAYGGLVVYFNRRYSIPYKKGSAVMLMSLHNAFAAIGILAYISIQFVPPDMIPVNAKNHVELVEAVGFYIIFFYLFSVFSAYIGRYIPGIRDQDHLFSSFNWCPFYAYPILLFIELIQMISHGIFAILTMSAFGLFPPKFITIALTQIVSLTHGLPVSMLGIGLDQVTFPFLFQGWGEPGLLLSFSIAFTFSQIAVRFLIGLPFFNYATKKMFQADQK